MWIQREVGVGENHQVARSDREAGAGPPASRLEAWLDLTRARPCLTWFLLIAIPAVSALCLLIGPFQNTDETAHFFRAVQISEGRMSMRASPEGDAAGDLLDANIEKLGSYYLYLQMKRWDASYGEGARDRAEAWATRPAGRPKFAAFSNTGIYFPLAHAAPALAIAAARAVGAPPMAWLYAARLTDAALATLLFALAILWFPKGRVLVLVLALLPRTLFQTAAVSPDALLTPFSALFAALALRLFEKRSLGRLEWSLLVASTLFVGVSKIAYIPFVAIPVAAALLDAGRSRRAVAVTATTAVVALVVWSAWAVAVGDKVHSIRPGLNIDVYAQLRRLVTNPLHGMAVLLNSIGHDGAWYADTLIGGQLASHPATFPRPLSAATLILLAGAMFVAARPARAEPRMAALCALVAAGCAIAVLLLLYLQFTPVGAPRVDGVQGRYFLPLLPILAAFLPKLRPGPRAVRWLSLAAVAWLALTSLETVRLIHARYGRLEPVSAARFDDPHSRLSITSRAEP